MGGGHTRLRDRIFFSGQKETEHMNVDLLIWKNMAERERGGGGVGGGVSCLITQS